MQYSAAALQTLAIGGTMATPQLPAKGTGSPKGDAAILLLN